MTRVLQHSSPSPAAEPRPERRLRPPRIGWTLRRYVTAEVLLPAVLALLGLSLVALTKSVLGFADLILNRGLGVREVGAIALYQAVPVLTQTLPFAGLLGTLIGLGRLKSDREIQALESFGFAPTRLVGPVFLCSVLFASLTLFLSVQGAPRARTLLDAAIETMVVAHPGAVFRAGEVLEFGDRQLLAREVSSGGDELRGVLLWLPEMGETIFAERARVEPSEPGSIGVTLLKASVLGSPEKRGSHFRFERFHTELRRNELAPGRDDKLRIDAAPLGRLSRVAASGVAGAADPELARLARAEIQRRFALPVACLVFGLLAVPVSFAGGGSSRSRGGLIGVGVALGYYALVQLGNGLLRYETFPVAPLVWLPNLVGVAVAAWLLRPGRIRSSGPATGGAAARRRAGAATAVSRRAPLDRYVLRLFVEMFLVSVLALVSAYLIVDVLERLQWLAQNQATLPEILRYYAARTPLLASRVIPMSLLAASALTIGLLSSHRELLGMQICGISLLRGLAPLPLFATLIVPVAFLMDDAVVPRANELADRIKVEEIKGGLEPGSGSTVLWFRTGGDLVRASRLGIERGEVRDLTIYELGPDNFPRSRTDAPLARRNPEGVWELTDASRVAISAQGVERVEAPQWIRFADPKRASLDPTHVGVRRLLEEIRAAEAGGFDSTAWRVEMHARLAAPLTCLLFTVLVVAYAMQTPTRIAPALALLASAGLAVSYILANDLVASFAYGGHIPPGLAGWGPTLVLVVLITGLLWRGER